MSNDSLNWWAGWGNKIFRMHESAFRLYLAAKEIKGIEGQTALARLLDQSPQTINNWEKRGVSAKGAIDAQAKIGCRADWVTTGEGPMLSSSTIGNNVEPGPAIIGHVPLLSTVEAGMFKDYVDNYQPSAEGSELVATPAPVGRHTFAMRVTGDSMEPEFHEGLVLIVEPDINPQHEDFVVVRTGNSPVSFRQLILDGDDQLLKPLNTRYPIKPLGSSEIIGVLRAVQKRYR